MNEGTPGALTAVTRALTSKPSVVIVPTELEDTEDPKDAVVNDETEDTASHGQSPRLLHWAQENNSTGVIKKCSV